MHLHIILIWLVNLALAPFANASANVTVFAASSLTNALSEIAEEFQQTYDVKVRLSFASSSALARQIIYGAPADIYFPANQRWLDYVIDQGVVDESSRVTLLSNALVLVAPNDSELDTSVFTQETSPSNALEWDLVSLLKSGRLAVGDPDHVPVGQYSKQALQHFGQWDLVKPHLARANNVRGALVLVEREEAPLGIVYRTDALISSKVTTITQFSEVSHDKIEYPMVMVSDKPSKGSVQFYQYLQSEAAKAAFLRHGFGVK
jgi:molybdate transport system substrate-binding protein